MFWTKGRDWACFPRCDCLWGAVDNHVATRHLIYYFLNLQRKKLCGSLDPTSPSFLFLKYFIFSVSAFFPFFLSLSSLMSASE